MTEKLFISTIFTSLIGLIIALPIIVNAADLKFYSFKNTYAEGETFLVRVNTFPKEETVYTAKIKSSYSADLLKIQYFNNWLPLSRPGHDLIDNTNGTLIKTGGFSGGEENRNVSE